MKTISEIRADFPILATKVYGKPLIYFDNGATTQKPEIVLNTLSEVYRNFNGNIPRGAHALSDRSSEEYENAREKVRSFINAEKKEEIILLGNHGSIICCSIFFREKFIRKDDEIIVCP